MVGHTQFRRITLAFLYSFSALLLFGSAHAQKLGSLEQIPVESYKGMREVERYQLKVAEKYYLKGEYKIALDEYEKFLSLYEASTGAAYSQLMWSHCLLRLRKVNTAIREGFQSVIDYWPESPEARTASFLIARSYQDIGEVEKAKLSYRQFIDEGKGSDLAILAKVKLMEMAQTEKDEEMTLSLLEELTFDTKRTEAAKRHCEDASRRLARHYFYHANTAEAVRALETTYAKGHSHLDHHIYDYGYHGSRHLLHNSDTQDQGKRQVEWLVDYFDQQIPTSLESDADKKKAWDALSRVAGIYGLQKDEKAILGTFERMEKMLGKSDELLGKVAHHYRHSGDREKAKEIYARYENEAAGKGQIASMLREEGKFEESTTLYRELIQLNPDKTSDYLWMIGHNFESMKQWKNAIQTYRQVDKFPDNYWRMSHCHRQLKEWSEALSLYSQAKANERFAPQASLLIAQTYEQAGQRENAIKAFQLTCRSYPKSSEASRAHAHLQTKYNITATFGGAKDEG